MTPVKDLARVLKGRFVQLEPIAPKHKDELRAAANDPAIWRYMPINGASDFEAWWKNANDEMAGGGRIPFAVRRLTDNTMLGSTSYMNIVPAHARAEIGWTWYAPAAQGTVVNAEAKLLLLANAFEACGYHRIELKTDSTNARSRAAILKLGAREEGIFRGHMWMPHGYWRDTVWYSILADEWPAVKSRLEARLAALG